MGAIQHCILSITDACLSKNLIPEESIDDVNVSKSERARRLLSCVRGSIRTENAKFHTFVEVLQAERYLEGALNQLQEEYSKFL